MFICVGVLVCARIKSIFFVTARMMQGFGFVTKAVLIIHGGLAVT